MLAESSCTQMRICIHVGTPLIIQMLATSKICLCICGDWFESRFVGYPEERFCRVEAHFTGIIPFSDCGEFAASLVSGVVSFMVEGRVGP